MDLFSSFFKILHYLPKNTYVLLFILIITRIVFKLLAPKIKGIIGENRVKNELEKLPGTNLYILNDVLINNSGTSTQIDHIIVSKYGIFVIETKHYKGWIHGSEFSSQWTQSIYKKKLKIPNPLKQNYGHIQHLKELLKDYPNITFFSIVVFTGSAELKNISTKSLNTHVINIKQLVKTINDNCTKIEISDEDFAHISSLIQDSAISDKNARKEHVNSIIKSKKNDLNSINEKVCPKCSGSLIERQGKYGDFVGCSNFPKCKYTSKI